MATGADSFQFILNDFLPLLKKLEEVLAIFGLLYLGKVGLATLLDLIVGFRAHLYSRLWRRNFTQLYGKWAIVTGCTDGIGKCYCEELAKEGLNLILISRNMMKLERVSSELVEKYNIKTEVVQVDFSEGKSIYDRISKSLGNKEVGMLINNVGVMLPYPKYFNEVTSDEIWSHVNVNIASVCSMIKLVLPQMEARGKGAIVNIASIAASGPIPLMGIYGASKAFVDSFSQALEWEYGSKGVTIQTVIPSYVATNMTSFSSWVGTANFITPSAAVFASHAVKTIGYTKRTTGYWVHGIQAWFVEKIMSRWAFAFFNFNAQKLMKQDIKKAP